MCNYFLLFPFSLNPLKGFGSQPLPSPKFRNCLIINKKKRKPKASFKTLKVIRMGYCCDPLRFTSMLLEAKALLHGGYFTLRTVVHYW